MEPRYDPAKEPQTPYGWLVSTVAGARCPACGQRCGVWQLAGTTSGRGRSRPDGLICGTCAAVFRLRRSIWRTVAWLPVGALVCLMLVPAACVAFLKMIDPRYGGWFFQDNGRGSFTFLASLVLVYPFFLSVVVTVVRVFGVELLPADAQADAARE